MIVLTSESTSDIAQRSDDTDSLWVRVDQLKQATGWQLKPEGVCLGEICVPLFEPEREAWIADADDWVWFCYSAFADKIGQQHVRDGDVWSLGSVPEVRRMGLESGLAPDFEMTDRYGDTVRLSDLRGRKVVLFTWASW